MVLPNIELDIIAFNVVLMWVSYVVPIMFGVSLGMLLHDWMIVKSLGDNGVTITWLKRLKGHARTRIER